MEPTSIVHHVHASALTYEQICSLPRNVGVCDINQLANPAVSYFYNSQTSACERFKYSGCHGNQNRFATEAECKTFCRVQERVTYPPTRRRKNAT